MAPIESLAVHAGGDLSENAFFQRGDLWVVAYKGKTVYLRDSVGLSYIAQLLAEPHRDILAVTLLASRVGIDPRIASGSSEEVMDNEAREECGKRYRELVEELAEAKNNNDIGRVERLEWEMEALTNQVASATDLCGRAREKSDIEKVRKSVSMAVSRAIGTIGKRHESLGWHLTVSITSGLKFRYAPEREIDWLG